MDFRSSNKLSEFIWINGKMIPWEEANVHVLTHSLHYSTSVFEGERAYEGKIFKLKEHTERLLQSAKSMHIEVHYSAEEINNATEELLRKNNLKNAYVRPLIWRGAETFAIHNPALSSHVLIMAGASNPPFKKGWRLWVSPWKKISEKSMPPQSKTSSHYGMLAISQKMAQDAGYDDALLIDQYNNIAECSSTNIFFGKNNMLVTPIADRFLNGITRQTVLEMAKNMGFEVKEKRMTLFDITEYDTCFITGTSAEVKGVASINLEDRKIEFTNDAVVDQLQQEYAKMVGKAL